MKCKNITIDIFGSTWNIVFVDKIESEDANALTEGITDSINRTIRIATDVPVKELEIVVFHELMHAILCTGQYLDATKDESTIEFIARSLYSLVKQKVISLHL